MDRVIVETQVFKCWGFSASQASYTPPYPNAIATGEGVFVGIVDTGIDFKHLDFKPTTGTNKVKWIWDQTQQGNPPGGFTYGREWSTNEILTEVCTSIDPDSRGTHLAGIMAACGRATAGTWTAYRYVGMAPMADIIAVKIWPGAASFVQGENWQEQSFVESKIRDGVDYCFQKAGSAPCVVILPMGHYRTGHDGTGTFDGDISGLVDAGPGRVVVCGSGNDGHLAFHSRMDLTSVGNQASATMLVPQCTNNPNVGENFEFQAWHDLTASFSVRLSSPNGISTGWVVPNTQVNILDTADGSIQLQNALTAQTTPKGKRIYWRVYEVTDGILPRGGTWKIEVERLSGTTTGILDLWFMNQKLSNTVVPSTFTSGVTSTMMSWSPSTADAVISTNAYVSKTQWRRSNGVGGFYPDSPVTHSIATFTNQGPRRDGEYRPDVSAPAYGVVSSYSADTNPVLTTYRVEDGLHRINSGRRAAHQSAAVTAGAIALFLQINPNATAEDARNWIRTNAKIDSYTGTTPNATWGYGKLQAFPVPVVVSEPLAMMHAIVLPASGQKFRFTALGGATFNAATVIDANVNGLVNGSPVDPGDEPVISNITSTTFDAQMAIQSQNDVAIVCTNITDPAGRVFAQDFARYSVDQGGTVTAWT